MTSAAALALISTATFAETERGAAARDDAATLATTGFLDARDDLDPAVFDAYWRDAHGPLAARIDGIHQYWQHHLGAPDPSVLPAGVAAIGIATAVSNADQLEGLAEVTFASEADRAGMGASPAAAQLMVDEQNAFKGTYLHSTLAGDTRTLIDLAVDGAPQGSRAEYRVILLIAANEAGDRAAFRDRISDAIAAPLAASQGAVKVRTHLFAPYAAAGWDTPNVDNDRTQDQAFDAWIELAFDTREAAQTALVSVETALASPEAITAVHAYPVRETYTLVYGGRPTVVGLRGYAVAATAAAVGADNQRSLPVLRSLHGPAVEAPAE
ncbi:MAG: EthD domain-containing protein [Pseudomonadota bacterium]